ncbi:receptor-like protein 9DC3 [Humulus lupulus]|uniref:receptor-like protein 9DC3 n=1 Tax=Humulus lupulus TaxID=3486 RepID=UPI002B40C0F0|nr:receptor-like protein 9DC3 [Humulus lupulus]
MWHGVECDEITGHVISLDLSSSYLYGSLDSNSSLFNLVHLQRLNLEDNHFNYSQIPSAIKKLSKLNYLNLADSFFSGQVPSEVSELFKLSHLYLCGNVDLVSMKYLLKLEKSNFESLISNLTSLEELCLSHVVISSTVPKSLGNLSSLTSLLLRECDLKGEFPANIFQLPNLQFLSVKLNDDLSGSLPTVFSSLIGLDVCGCNFSGMIPDSMGKLNQLIFLDLSQNKFIGKIPSFVGNLTQLNELSLHSNKFSGPVPLSLSKLVNLETLFLDSNNLSGILDFDMLIGMKNLSALGLSENKLSLVFSSRIDETFPQLTTLRLSRCNLRNFPDFLRHQKRIVDLKLTGNHISGQIPDWMLSISRETLSILYLSENSLIGELSSAVCNLSSLKLFDISSNKLGGKLPHCLCRFSKSLSILSLRNNTFTGNIPEFTEGIQLRIIDFGYNLFEGKLSKSLTNCRMLGYLNMESNNLNDVFPYWLGILPELEVLVLKGNEFHGIIGDPMTNLHFPKLRIIDLSYNNFIGKLPLKYIQSWKAMRSTSIEDFNYLKSIPFKIKTYNGYSLNVIYFYHITIAIKGKSIYYKEIQNIIAVINLSNNKFDGEIPEIIGKLKGLYSLDLSNNRLKGVIPSSLGNLRGLESLDLSQNELSREIPSELDRLSFLGYFNVSYNHLSGSIPQYHLSTFESSCYEGNLGLCGIPLPNLCGHSKPLEQPLPSFEEDSSTLFQFGWKVVAVGYGCGFLIGLFVEKFVNARKPNWLVMIFGISS